MLVITCCLKYMSSNTEILVFSQVLHLTNSKIHEKASISCCPACTMLTCVWARGAGAALVAWLFSSPFTYQPHSELSFQAESFPDQAESRHSRIVSFHVSPGWYLPEHQPGTHQTLDCVLGTSTIIQHPADSQCAFGAGKAMLSPRENASSRVF